MSVNCRSQRDLSLCVKRSPIFDETGAAIEAELVRRGYDVMWAIDGDKRVLDRTALLLVGDARHFGGFSKLLTREKASRPTTVLWHHEPLLPPETPNATERVARALLSDDAYRKLPRGPIREIARWCIRRRRAGIARRFRREFTKAAPCPYEISPGELCFAVNEAAALLEHMRWGWIDHLFCTTTPRIQYLASRGIEASHVPMGYHPSLGGELPGQVRDIDVLFLGRFRGTRRGPHVRSLKRLLDQRGIVLTIVDKACYGQQRAQLLSRTKVVVNLLSFPWDFPGYRLLFSAACGAMVVSESCGNTEPFVDGTHFVGSRLDDLPRTIAHYLRDEPARSAIAANARKFVTRQLTLQNCLDRVLDAVPHSTTWRRAS
ncbi:MAG: glycosyltransferase [Pirellulaceae bacterium]